MDLLAMRPSEWRTLGERLLDQDVQHDFLIALREFLIVTVNDNGTDADRVYTTAVKASKSGVWDRIPVRSVAAALNDVSTEVVGLFLGGIPSAIREQLLVTVVLNGLEASRQENIRMSNDKVVRYSLAEPTGRGILEPVESSIAGSSVVATALSADTALATSREDALLLGITQALRSHRPQSRTEENMLAWTTNLPWVVKSSSIR